MSRIFKSLSRLHWIIQSAARGFVMAISFALTLILIFVGYWVYAAYAQLPTATSGAPLTSTMWNNAMTAINQHGTDLSNLITTVGTLTGAIMVNGSKVGIGTANPAEAIDTNGGNIKMGWTTVNSVAMGSVAASTWGPSVAVCPGNGYPLSAECWVGNTGVGTAVQFFNSSNNVQAYNNSGSPSLMYCSVVCANIR